MHIRLQLNVFCVILEVRFLLVSISLVALLFSLHGFTDVDWASNIDDHKSMGGYLVFWSYTDFLEVRQTTHDCSFFYQN
jgi:hypothetical protein